MKEQITENNIEARLQGPRPPRLEEREQLIAMINFIFRSSVGRAPTIAADWAHVYTPENLANVAVMVDPDKEDDPTVNSGKLVASTGVWACDVMVGEVSLRVGGINCVGTLPAYRRFGLGSKMMAAAHQTMRDLGCHVGLLSTGIPNWYRRMGWEEAGAVRSYRLNRGNVGLLPQLRPGLQWRFVEIGEVIGEVDVIDEEANDKEANDKEANDKEANDKEANDKEVVAQILGLYHTARLGATRTVAAFRQRVTAREMKRVAVAEGAHGIAAYLLLRDHLIYEWAGAAAEVAGLVRAVYEALDDPSVSTSQRASEGSALLLRALTLQTPGWGHPLLNMLDARRIPQSRDYLGMLYLVDPQAVLDAYGLADVQLESVGDQFIVRAGNGTLTLDRRQLTKLFFGPERVSDLAGTTFPLPFWQWNLERV